MIERRCRFAERPRGFPRGRTAEMELAAEAQALNDLLVAILGLALDVIQVLAAHRDELEETAARREVFAVDIQVIRNVVDPLGEQGHLIGGAAGVSFMELEFFQVDCVVAHGSKGWFQLCRRNVLGWWFGAESSSHPSLGKQNAAAIGDSPLLF